METRPKQKSFSIPPFALHSARGIVRDATARRRVMFGLLGLAVIMVICGSSFLRELLNPHEHAGRFILFWLACAWFCFTALLLAVFDVLIVRMQARAARRNLRKGVAGSSDDSA